MKVYGFASYRPFFGSQKYMPRLCLSNDSHSFFLFVCVRWKDTSRRQNFCGEPQEMLRPVSSYDNVHMRHNSREQIMRRASRLSYYESSRGALRCWLLDYYPTDLIVCGEAGSGKTHSVLSLGNEGDATCVYMLAEDVAAHLDNVTKEMGSDGHASKENKWASCIVRELVAIVPTFSVPLQTASEFKKLFIVVDDADPYPELVQSTAVRLLLEGPPRYPNRSLAEHLNLDRVRAIQLVVVSAGAKPIAQLRGSCPQVFTRMQVENHRYTYEMKCMTADFHKVLPWFESFTKFHAESGEVRQLEAIKDNARMYSFFIEAAESSTVFQRITAQSKENADVRLDAVNVLRSCGNASRLR